MMKENLENLMVTGYIDGKRDIGKQRITFPNEILLIDGGVRNLLGRIAKIEALPRTRKGSKLKRTTLSHEDTWHIEKEVYR